jgi:hypothetical protein
MTGRIEAIDALFAQARVTARTLHLDLRPSRGRHPALWLVWANALLDPIRTAWYASGRRGRLSLKPRGPVITILCRALEAIDGCKRDEAAVASALRRQAASRAKVGRN